mmetsp:Transcript_21801/g.54346  ORF Transcript_21801/g.54346 Transcript_21801/m.54346 type:complete len:229 (+) Transcript_21801:330-1016(+)|eukprot:CAMPEP_0182797882 /NCGR_PEP_ID=MMETSP0006_2-20121128/1056_1 /TAXON_ID=97485 /ORGANISM="Prymnesium parvum, Strain Texoma1" /LENGTH=228 /DNA_ID=CAMNT_0024922967 /DNA_START=265 /DNA_END=951 /DNA_ORIENTATION=-
MSSPLAGRLNGDGPPFDYFGSHRVAKERLTSTTKPVRTFEIVLVKPEIRPILDSLDYWFGLVVGSSVGCEGLIIQHRRPEDSAPFLWHHADPNVVERRFTSFFYIGQVHEERVDARAAWQQKLAVNKIVMTPVVLPGMVLKDLDELRVVGVEQCQLLCARHHPLDERVGETLFVIAPRGERSAVVRGDRSHRAVLPHRARVLRSDKAFLRTACYERGALLVREEVVQL